MPPLNNVLTLNDVNAELLKKQYLTGLKIIGEDGQELPEEFYNFHLQGAISKFEDLTGVVVIPRTIVAEKHDYRITDYQFYGFIQLFLMPLQSVQQIAAVYPTGQVITVYPNDWVKVEPVHSQLHIVPMRGSLSSVVIGAGGDFLPFIYGGLGYLPQLWQVDYTCGLDSNNLPRSVVEAIMKLAAVEVLTIVSDLIRPLGVNSESLGVDGLSQSRSYVVPPFQARLARYLADLYGPNNPGSPSIGMTTGLLRQLRDQYFGINLTSL